MGAVEGVANRINSSTIRQLAGKNFGNFPKKVVSRVDYRLTDGRIKVVTGTKPTKRKGKTMKTDERITELKDAGAWYGKAEDRDGRTRTGWWMDGVYLGKTERDALEAIHG
jgi:hypothetical protein